MESHKIRLQFEMTARKAERKHLLSKRKGAK
jgi:hypothetical protein